MIAHAHSLVQKAFTAPHRLLSYLWREFKHDLNPPKGICYECKGAAPDGKDRCGDCYESRY